MTGSRKRSPERAHRAYLDAGDFANLAAGHFVAAANAWLTGSAPFTAKLHPEYAPYGDYDQLMRLDEWYGRESAPAPRGDGQPPPGE